MKISTRGVRLARALFKQRIQLNAVKMEVDESRVRGTSQAHTMAPRER